MKAVEYQVGDVVIIINAGPTPFIKDGDIGVLIIYAFRLAMNHDLKGRQSV